MFLTLMTPSLVLFLVLWVKLVKDFLKVRCRLGLLRFLISCLIWLELVGSMQLIKERILVIIFFFSSRRRHTRCSRDWSSDVCSSDLARHGVQAGAAHADHADARQVARGVPGPRGVGTIVGSRLRRRGRVGRGHRLEAPHEIGRASCRERV